MINLEFHKGLTLIELLIGTAISTIIIGSILTFQSSIADVQSNLNTNSRSHIEANIAIQAITREIRNAKPAATGAYPIELAEDFEIIFYANIDNDPIPEKIRYFLSDSSLQRGVIKATGSPPTYTSTEQITLVIPNITNNSQSPIFTYYNGNWPSDETNNPLPAPARLLDTKMVTINILINPNPKNTNHEYHIESAAQIRNLKTNL